MADKKVAVGNAQAAHPAGLLSLLADEQRLQVIAAIIVGFTDEREIASRTGLTVTGVRRIIQRLMTAGLIGIDEGIPQIRLDAIKKAARAAAKPPDPGIKAADPKVAIELAKFFRGGRLHTIPANRKKLELVLDYLSSLFEPGRYYTEREVNMILHRVHDDHATFRRYLVDRGFLARDRGRYWRVGGSVEVD